MSYCELFVSPSLLFAGLQKTFQEAEYAILGVPFDGTSTYRTGARFAPTAIREASLNLETYSFRAGMDLEELKLHDLGDLHITGEVNETLKRLELVVKDLLEEKKIPVCIGGEHTITLGAVRGIEENFALVSFDAHLDLRNKYLGRTISHATFMRRICEQIGSDKILEIGVRAACKEELDYAKKVNLQFVTVQQIRKEGFKKTMKNIENFLANHEKIYLTIDMDVLDPAFSLAVQNPEPDGLSMNLFLNILSRLCNSQIIASDIVEVAPNYDHGTTTLQAAKTIFEVLCHMECSRKQK